MSTLISLLEDTEKLAENFHRALAALQYSRTDEDLEDLHDAECEWLHACDLAALELDRIEDSLIRLGLTLRYVNNCPWSQVAAELGCPDIEARVADYLKTKGGENYEE